MMVEASLDAMISSRLNVRFASSTRPSTLCVPSDRLPQSSCNHQLRKGRSRSIEVAAAARGAEARVVGMRAAVAKAAVR
eukprot:scaffold36983_cov67-Phaeocystis_antarctica.AAC.7